MSKRKKRDRIYVDPFSKKLLRIEAAKKGKLMEDLASDILMKHLTKEDEKKKKKKSNPFKFPDF